MEVGARRECWICGKRMKMVRVRRRHTFLADAFGSQRLLRSAKAVSLSIGKGRRKWIEIWSGNGSLSMEIVDYLASDPHEDMVPPPGRASAADSLIWNSNRTELVGRASRREISAICKHLKRSQCELIAIATFRRSIEKRMSGDKQRPKSPDVNNQNRNASDEREISRLLYRVTASRVIVPSREIRRYDRCPQIHTFPNDQTLVKTALMLDDLSPDFAFSVRQRQWQPTDRRHSNGIHVPRSWITETMCTSEQIW